MVSTHVRRDTINIHMVDHAHTIYNRYGVMEQNCKYQQQGQVLIISVTRAGTTRHIYDQRLCIVFNIHGNSQSIIDHIDGVNGGHVMHAV